MSNLSELDMENAIAAEPEKFLGESGLKLVSRQHRVGSYIFDLLFEDRQGAKMIVEVQLGTLDRNHTYKILDYYHEYKKKHLGEFVELMVVANMIPHERRERLNDLGVNWREIPIEKFLLMDSAGKGSPRLTGDSMHNETSSDIKKIPSVLTQTPPHTKKGRQESHESPPVSYILFKEQTHLFINNLDKIQPPVRVTVDGSNVSPHNPGNWFTCFAPISWGRKVPKASSGPGSGYGSGVGVGYGFSYTTNREGSPFVRLASSIENPFRHEFRDRFRKEVSEKVRSLNISFPLGCRIWPDTKFPDFRFRGKTILECQPVPLDKDTWRKVLDNYRILNKGYNEVVAQFLRKYYADGAFKVDIIFD